MGNWEVIKINPPHLCTNVNTIQHHRQLDFQVMTDLIYPYVLHNTSIKILQLPTSCERPVRSYSLVLQNVVYQTPGRRDYV